MRKLIVACYDVAYAARNGHRKIVIQIVDADDVLAMTVAQGLQSDELCLAFGTGKSLIPSSP